MSDYSLKEMMKKPERLAPGHRMCAGCGATIAVRAVLRGLHEGDHAVIGNATGCLEVSSYMYPYTAWEDSYIHNAFENAGATLSGVETAYKALKKRGRIPADVNYKFITFGGDGGTYDIGFQSLSGAMERGHDMVYVCYDNGAYMNTGIQRSSATPMYADTTTTPVGKKSDGKLQGRKDLASIIADHNVAYVAQTTLTSNFVDIHKKSEKAIYTEGASFLNVMAPCPRGKKLESRPYFSQPRNGDKKHRHSRTKEPRPPRQASGKEKIPAPFFGLQASLTSPPSPKTFFPAAACTL